MTGATSPGPTAPTWSDSWWLVLRALGWLLGVTLPATVVLAMFLPGAIEGWGMQPEPWWLAIVNVLLWMLMVVALSSLPAVLAAVVAWPLTMLLGRAMRSVRSRALHVVATSALAGVLAALPLALLPVFVLFVPMSIAAGAAAALARNGEFRRADRLAAAAAHETDDTDETESAPAGSS